MSPLSRRDKRRYPEIWYGKIVMDISLEQETRAIAGVHKPNGGVYIIGVPPKIVDVCMFT